MLKEDRKSLGNILEAKNGANRVPFDDTDMEKHYVWKENELSTAGIVATLVAMDLFHSLSSMSSGQR